MRKIEIYTDGACSGNQVRRLGAVLFTDQKKELSGGEHNTTNQRMELKAPEALKALKVKGWEVTIF